MIFEKLRKILKASNTYQRASDALEGKPDSGRSMGGMGTFTSAAEQDKMRRELEDARSREIEKVNLRSYRPPKRVHPKKRSSY